MCCPPGLGTAARRGFKSSGSDRKIRRIFIQRILAQADVRPHRLERYMASDDPDFETKAADVIGLYLAPPQHAAVFCVDEKTAIQALDRLDPVLPLSPGRLERHGFEYRRNGTLSLYAALDVKTGKVQGKTAERHTSAEFVDFLEQVVSGCKPQQEIHIILDNLSAHKTSQVERVSEAKPQREASLHAHLFFLAQSGRDLVRQAGARSHRPRHLHFGPGSLAQTHALHPRLFENRPPLQMEILRRPQENPPMLTNSLRRATRTDFSHAAFLAIEILSKDDRASELLEKLDDYRYFAIPFVRVIDPRSRLDHAYSPGQWLQHAGRPAHQESRHRTIP